MKKIPLLLVIILSILPINAQWVEYFEIETLDMYKAYNFNDSIHVELTLDEALQNKDRTFYFDDEPFYYVSEPDSPSKLLTYKALDTISFWPAIYDQLLFEKLKLDWLLKMDSNRKEKKEDVNIYNSPYPQKLSIVEKLGSYYILHAVRRKYIPIEFSMG